MAKTEKTPALERTYNIPLRKEYLKVPRWKRTKRAVSALRKFLQRHLKSEQVKIGPYLNEALWQHGIKNPPHHVKVTALKDEKGIVRAELFGHQIQAPKEEKKPSKLEEVAKKVGLKTEKKEEKKPAEKKEAKESKEIALPPKTPSKEKAEIKK